MTWDGLARWHQDALIMKWLADPVLFVQHEYGLSIGDWNEVEERGVWPSQEEIIGEFYSPTRVMQIREGILQPYGPYNELWLVAGMRSSKTWLEGTFGAIETFRFLNIDYRARYAIGPSSPAYGLCVASKEQQALDTNFAQLKARFEDSFYFKDLLRKDQLLIQAKAMILPDHNFFMRACSSAVAGEVGRTNKFLLVDEVDRFETTSGPRSGEEMYRLLTKGTKTFKYDGNSFFCGSPASYQSLSMRKLKEAEGDSHMYGINRPTWEMNPSFTYEDFERDFNKDPFAAMRDWAADPQAGSDVYFRNLDMITWAEHGNVLERMYRELPVESQNQNYVMAVDPASPKSANNAFGMALGYKAYDEYVIEGILQVMPHASAEIDPIKLGKFILSVIEKFPVLKFYSDTWNYPIVQEQIRRKGVQVVNNIVRRPHYELFKEALYERKVRIPYYKPLIDELRGIVEVNVTRVDHPRHGSKDVADCVVQVVNALAETVSDTPHVGVIIV